MRVLVGILLSLLALMLCSCQLSFLPFYADNDEIDLPSIVGSWVGEEEVWNVTHDSSGYRAINPEAPHRVYELHFFKVDTLTFADITQVANFSTDLFDPDLYYRLHVVARIDLHGDTLLCGVLQEDWFNSDDETRAMNVPTLETETGRILAASPDQLRPLLAKFAFDESVFYMEDLIRRSM